MTMPVSTGNENGVVDLTSLLGHEIPSPAVRISIYQNNYQLALVNCLKSTFIHTHRLLGESIFNEWALEYIDAYPSQSEDLNHYGENFSEFISTKGSDNNGDAQEQSVVFYVAQSDYLKQCCYYASNNQTLAINEFINMPIDVQMSTYFIRQSSLFLLYSPFDLTDISSIKSIKEVPINENLTYYLFFRNEGKVQAKILNKALYNLLTVFEQKTNMNALNEVQLEQLPILLREGWLKLVGAMI